MTSTRSTVPAERQPLRPAVALAVLALLSILGKVVGIVLVWVLASSGILEGAGAGAAQWDTSELAIGIILVSLVGMLVIALGIGVQIAMIVLGILVVVRGDGKLRIGGSILLATAALGMFSSFSVDVSFGTDAVSTAFAVLATVVQVLMWCLSVGGLVVLWLGIREVRRARAEHSPALR